MRLYVGGVLLCAVLVLVSLRLLPADARPAQDEMLAHPLAETAAARITPHAMQTADAAHVAPDADRAERHWQAQTPTSAYSLGMPAITPRVEATLGLPAIATADVLAWVVTHPHPFLDLDAPAPTVESVHCMSALEAHEGHGVSLVLPDETPVCVVTLRGRFATDGAPMPGGTQVLVSDTGRLLFDAQSGHLVTYGLGEGDAP